jgi:hypothetical protein
MSARLVADIFDAVVDVLVSLAETRGCDALVGDALSGHVVVYDVMCEVLGL